MQHLYLEKNEEIITRLSHAILNKKPRRFINKLITNPVLLLNFITALFLIVYGLLMMVSVLRKRKSVYISNASADSKNSFISIIIGIVSIITGIIALLLYVV